MWPAERPVIPTGDIEAACIEILNASAALLAFEPVISTDMVGFGNPETQAATPGVNPYQSTRWIYVSREGGNDRFPFDHPRVDVSTFAKRRVDAFDMANIARAELLAASGYRGHGLVILTTQEEVGLVRSADGEDTSMYRYFGSLRFLTRAIDDES